MVMTPAPVTTQRHSPVPPRWGERRANRKTPALTMVAERGRALTGVGAVMAPGSQKWNGHCADLLAAPAMINSSAAR